MKTTATIIALFTIAFSIEPNFVASLGLVLSVGVFLGEAWFEIFDSEEEFDEEEFDKKIAEHIARLDKKKK